MGLLCALALLTVVFGVLGLFDRSRAEQIVGSRVDLHAIFGLLLCTLIAARFLMRLEKPASAPQTYIRELSRELSRMVYLLLYLIIGLHQSISLADRLRYGGSAESANFSANDDLQAIVAYGIVGLLLIRGMTFIALRRRIKAAPSAAACHPPTVLPRVRRVSRGPIARR
jgi:hypothetical protein